ncbi:MAG: class I SAM-dependent methyltransferase [Acidimicrobiales bacterium]|jgi:SAM-dependent methyltransferase
MPIDRDLRAVHEYYERGQEEDRLAEPRGTLEFERTREILLRHLPQAPATVADVGGGPGRYAMWLAELGYRVFHRDIVPLHAEQTARLAGGHPAIETAVADARRLDLEDECADAVLLLGPLYHLDRRPDRLQALREARRVLRPGGWLFAAAISRWAVRLDGILRSRLYEVYPEAEGMLEGIERSGRIPPLFPGDFCGYCHRPRQLRAELISAGLDVVDLVAIEGPGHLLDDLPERVEDDRDRRVVLDTACALERVPELLGASPHMLATARRRPGER